LKAQSNSRGAAVAGINDVGSSLDATAAPYGGMAALPSHLCVLVACAAPQLRGVAQAPTMLEVRKAGQPREASEHQRRYARVQSS